LGTKVVLFARLRADDRSFWCLGPARYVSHEGEQPIAITRESVSTNRVGCHGVRSTTTHLVDARPGQLPLGRQELSS
jgi:hypothetical protein